MRLVFWENSQRILMLTYSFLRHPHRSGEIYVFLPWLMRMIMRELHVSFYIGGDKDIHCSVRRRALSSKMGGQLSASRLDFKLHPIREQAIHIISQLFTGYFVDIALGRQQTSK